MPMTSLVTAETGDSLGVLKRKSSELRRLQAPCDVRELIH